MSPQNTGWFLFIASLGMMAALVSNDITSLEAWESATSPAFVGKLLANVGTVITAFIGGKMIPTDKNK